VIRQILRLARLARQVVLGSFASATPAATAFTSGSFVRLAAKTAEDGLAAQVARGGVSDESQDAGRHGVGDGRRLLRLRGQPGVDQVAGPVLSRHGFSTTPILYKDSIILNGDQDAEAYVVALDKTTGVEKWRIDRGQRIRSYCAR